VKLHPVIWSRKAGLLTMAFLKPFGFWGLGALSFVDAGLFPIPPTMDLVLIGYVSANPSRLLLYCFAAAVGSALGSLIPYYIGRAGGELFLLKRINRDRYEKLRDRFEKQEFLVIAIPAMIPPPFPLKLFEFAAGVFEMKPLPFLLAIFSGKFVRFLAFGMITVLYGPAIVSTVGHAFHQHLGLILAGAGAIIIVIGLFVTRKIFDRRNGTQLPIEDADRPA
jgi:membrane protein YqaA with SNARE-associated domain